MVIYLYKFNLPSNVFQMFTCKLDYYVHFHYSENPDSYSPVL